MERAHALGRVVGHSRGDERPPVPALDGVALDAEPVLDQRTEPCRDPAPAQGLLRSLGEPVAGQRRRDDLVARLGEQWDQTLELEHRARPAVDEHDRRAFARPDEVNAVPGRVLEFVEPALSRAPVVIRRPVLAQASQEPLIHPVFPADVRRIRPTRPPEALAEVIEDRLVD